MKNKSDPQDLRTRTKQFALRVIRLYGALPNRVAAQVIGKQLLRSGTSVGAHYREAQQEGQEQAIMFALLSSFILPLSSFILPSSSL